jgi:hypothetical protein
LPIPYKFSRIEVCVARENLSESLLLDLSGIIRKDIPMLIYLTKDTSVALRKG